MFDQPTLLLSPRPAAKTGFGLFALHEDEISALIDIDVARYDELSELGYRVCMLGPKEFNSGYAHLWRYVQQIEEKRPGVALLVDISSVEEAKKLLWSRDIFQAYGGLVFTPKDNAPLTKKIFFALGVSADDVDLHFSSLGEGGCIVRSEDHLFFSERLTDLSGLDLLVERGYQPYSLPGLHYREKAQDLVQRTQETLVQGYLKTLSRCQRLKRFLVPGVKQDKNLRMEIVAEGLVSKVGTRMGDGQHLDTSLNVVLSPEGNFAICVADYYYLVFQEEVDALVAQLDATLGIIVDYEEVKKYSVNFVTLTDSRVIVGEEFRSTRNFLAYVLGEDRVLTAPVQDSDWAMWGGMRCRTNFIE